MIGWIISLLSGALGGNLAGSLLKGSSLGVLGNSAVGILGGGIGGGALSMLGLDVGGGEALNISSILGNLASGGVGGGILMTIIGLIRSVIGK